MAASLDEKWSTDETWTIDRLDGTNWPTWKFQINHLLLAKGLWDYVDGTAVLADDADNQQKARFRQQSLRAFSTIALSISTRQLHLVISCQDPQEAWEPLRPNFERDTLANKLFLKKQYFHMQMKNGTPIENLLKYMKELTDKLAAIGAPIFEEDQVVTLLGSIPPSYFTLDTALEARVNDISLRFVQQALIHKEQKRSGQFSQASDTSCGQANSVLVGVQKKGYHRKLLTCFKSYTS